MEWTRGYFKFYVSLLSPDVMQICTAGWIAPLPFGAGGPGACLGQIKCPESIYLSLSLLLSNLVMNVTWVE